MPGEAFYWILNMSISASLVGAVLLLLRKIKKFPRRLIFILWAVPFLRMWMPVSIGSRYGLMGFLARVGLRTVTVYEKSEVLTTMNCVGAAESYFPVVYKINVLEKIFNGAFIVWLIGCVTFLVVLIFVYVGTKREVCRGDCFQLTNDGDDGHGDDGFATDGKRNLYPSNPLMGKILLSDKISSPAVYGILHPQIVIPASYHDMNHREKDLTYILAHENVHIKRHDNLWRLAAFATACLHWFNPFVWLFLKLFLEDMELTCDEKVLAGLDGNEKKAYALALVECAADEVLFASAFGGADLHKRVSHILSYKRVSVFSTLCFTVLAAMIAYALLTNGI